MWVSRIKANQLCDIAYRGITDISINEIESMKKNRNDFVVLYHIKGCGFCTKAIPLYEKKCEEKRIKEYYMCDMTRNNTPFNYDGFPVFEKIKSGEVADAIVGLIDYNDVKWDNLLNLG